jgi:hypothetical protein
MANLNEQLSPNFVLGEMVRSETAERNPALRQQQENPPQEVIDNLRYLCQTTLQPIRNRLNFPLEITSGYRCEEVNRLVGGVPTSQHRVGQAADCRLASRFLTDPATQAIRQEIQDGVRRHTGRPLRADVNPDFYLFAFVCLHLNEFDIDQVIHEYGQGLGKPAWVHIAASRQSNNRQILAIGDFVTADTKNPDLRTALSFGT